jgi:hypothetical protein
MVTRLRQSMSALAWATMPVLVAVATLTLLSARASAEAGRVSPASGTPICGVIDADTTWTLDGSPYLVTCNTDVALGVTLTVEPGVVVQLSHAQLAIYGNLVAEGEDQQPITFTSAQANPTPGDWVRLWFAKPQGVSVLEHVIVEYAGDLSCGGIHFDAGTLTVEDSIVRYGANDGVRALEVAGNSTLTITDSDISYNTGHGIHFDAQDSSVSFTARGNTLVGNGQYAISLHAPAQMPISPVLADNTGSGNGTDGISLDVLLASTTLSKNPGLPYIVQSLTTTPDSTLQVEAGTIFKADLQRAANGTKVQIKGVVEIDGTSDEPVVFTSLNDDAYGGDTNRDGNASQPAPGDWRGINVELPAIVLPLPDFQFTVYVPLVERSSGGGAASSVQPARIGPAADPSPPGLLFNHVIIRYGGYDQGNLELFGGEAQINNSTIEHSAGRGLYAEDVQLELTDSTLRENGTDGLWLYGRDVAIAPVLLNNQFLDNGGYGAYLIFNGGCHPDMDVRDNTGSGNGWVNGIYMEGYVDVPQGCRWGPNPEFPYVLWTITVSETGRLMIDPGTVVKFTNPAQDRGSGTFIVWGTLQALGGADAPIAFTSFWDDALGGDSDGSAAPPAPGDWMGVLIQPGAHALLTHTLVRYGGANGTNLSVIDASLRLEESEVAFSANKGLGIQMSETSQSVTAKNNTFVDNGGYAISQCSTTATPTRFSFEGNEGSGNGVSGIFLDTALDTMTLQPNPTLPYSIQSLTVASGKTVTVEPGVVFKGDADYSGGGSLLAVDGVLQVQGTANNPVYLTSLHDDTVGGDTLDDGNAVQPGAGDWRGIVVREGGQINLDHTIMRYSGSDGTSLLATGGTLQLTNSEISYSADKGLSIQMQNLAQPPTIKDSTFVGNGGYAISLCSTTTTPVRFNVEGNEGSGNGVSGILLDATLDTMTLQPNPTLPYFIQSLTVASGRTVTVEPGVVFKGDADYSAGGSLLAVDGVLQVQGTANNPVYLTSLHDDTVGGDTLGDGNAVQPGAGDWRGIDVKNGGQVNMTYAALRYAGSDNIGLLNVGGQVSLDHAQVLYNQGNGVANQQGGVLTVVHSLIAYNTGSGICNSADGTVTATYNDIVGNQGYGIYSSQPLGDYSQATNNYWGSVDGPSWDDNYCANPPEGSGEMVTCHNLVWEPFVSSPYYP